MVKSLWTSILVFLNIIIYIPTKTQKRLLPSPCPENPYFIHPKQGYQGNGNINQLKKINSVVVVFSSLMTDS